MSEFPFISVLTFVPLLGGLALLSLGGGKVAVARPLALAVSLGSLVIAFLLCSRFDPATADLQFAERAVWIPSLGVEYRVGVDGLALVFVLLTAVVTPMALLASWRVQERVPLYFGLMLSLQAGLFGTFTAQNFFHWFLFWELSLIPAFFLIRLWGGPRRAEAATQFFVYTMVGSIALLLSFLAIYVATGTFDFPSLSEKGRNGRLIMALSEKLAWYDLTRKKLALVIFAGAFLGFAVKVPLFPLHTWLPATYAEAPTGVVMVLTGLMSKMGVYGFLRILVPIFPQEIRWVLKGLLALAVVSIVFSAAAALAQKDLKRMLAYSSINHLGYCLLGIFAVMDSAGSLPAAQMERTAALNGVLLQVFNHGLTAATLFWFVGILEQRGGGFRGVGDFGGLRKTAPVFCGLMGIAVFSSLGLPGLNGFPGEFLIFKGALSLTPLWAVLALPGLLLTALFLLTTLQRVFFGPQQQRWVTLSDLTPREIAVMAPAIALMFLLGVYPQILIRFYNSTVLDMVTHLRF